MSDVRPFTATTWQGNAALVVGPYRLFEVLGSGGNGLVYRAVHTADSREVALKILSPTIAADSTWRARFIREARQLSRINSPHVVGCSDLGEQDGTLYMALELVRGGDAEALVRSSRDGLSETMAARLALDTARGLQAVHEVRLIHRDVKPSNLLLTADQRIKLADFGLVQVLDQHRPLTLGGKIVGTPAFMSPEQIDGDAELDARSDLYSLASTLFYLLTGKPPFHGPSPWSILNQVLASPVPDPRRVVGGIGERIASIVLKAGALHREDRYRTAADMAEDLTSLLAGNEPLIAPLVALGGTPRIARPAKRAARIMLIRPPGAGNDPLADRLRSESFRVDEERSAEAVMERIIADPPDLLVMDLTDPTRIGPGSLRMVRHRLEHGALPILALTSPAELGIEEAWRSGASQVLVITHMGPEDFLREIRRTIGIDSNDPQMMPVTQRFNPQDARLREMSGRISQACAHARSRLETLSRPGQETTLLTTVIEDVAGSLRAAEAPAADISAAAHALLKSIQALLRELNEMPHHATRGTLRTVGRGIDAAARVASQESGPGLAGRTALVVDDDAVSRLMMTNALRVVGVAADAAADAAGAMAAAERRRYDLVFSDVMMDGLNGFQFVGRLRQLPTYLEVPVVFVTSLADFDQFFRSIPGGACDLIAKPFLLTELGLKALIHLVDLPASSTIDPIAATP